ncbi:hypothetical protein ACTPEF_23795, partial [Clostridioides difficile]
MDCDFKDLDDFAIIDRLSTGYIVSWCVGHLVGLSEAAAYGEQYKKWSYDSLPILPQEWKYT